MLEMDTLGSMPLDPDDNRSLIQALEAMEDTIDDRAVVAIHARRALELDPACASAMLVLAESATTRAERIALLKEVVSIGKREFRETACGEICWWWTSGTRTLMVALADSAMSWSSSAMRTGQPNATACFSRWIRKTVLRHERLWSRSSQRYRQHALKPLGNRFRSGRFPI